MIEFELGAFKVGVNFCLFCCNFALLSSEYGVWFSVGEDVTWGFMGDSNEPHSQGSPSGAVVGQEMAGIFFTDMVPLGSYAGQGTTYCLGWFCDSFSNRHCGTREKHRPPGDQRTRRPGYQRTRRPDDLETRGPVTCSSTLPAKTRLRCVDEQVSRVNMDLKNLFLHLFLNRGFAIMLIEVTKTATKKGKSGKTISRQQNCVQFFFSHN